jgi:rhodanese-related sulfurtransferase
MPTDIDRNRVQSLVKDGAQLMEVLPQEEYQDWHLPGAINLPLKELDRQTTVWLQREQPVIVYCSDSQ